MLFTAYFNTILFSIKDEMKKVAIFSQICLPAFPLIYFREENNIYSNNKMLTMRFVRRKS